MSSHKKKHIVLLVTNDLLTDWRVKRIASSLAARGANITLIGRRLQATYPDNWPAGITVKRFRLLFNKGPLFYACYNIRAFIYLLLHRFDIVVANDLDTLPAAYLAKRKNQQLVYDSHELFTEVPELIHRPTVQRFWEQIEKRILPKLATVYTVSNSIAEYYNEKYGINFKIIRNLPQTKAYDNVLPNDALTALAKGKKIILYQGALNIGRGLEQMIEAMPLLQHEAVFVLLGTGDIEALLMEKVRQLHLEQQVYFLGRKPAEKLPAYTIQADIGISLEQDGYGLSYRYALPNKLFDYIHARVPVLASALPEIKHIVETYKVGRVINDFSPQHLANTIRNMLHNPEQLEQWKQNEEKAAGVLNWEQEQKKLITIYHL